MANTNPMLERVCDIIWTVLAVLTGLGLTGISVHFSGAAWAGNEDAPELFRASTWSDTCMCACDWTTGPAVTQEGWKGKTLVADSCSLSDFEVVRCTRLNNHPRDPAALRRSSARAASRLHVQNPQD